MNLKKKIIGGLGLGLLLGAVTPLTASAVVVDTGETDVTVTFTGGELELVTVPDLIDFGTNVLTADEETFTGTIVSDDDGFLEVADARGTGEGWHIVASMTGFTEGGDPSLPGSTITFAAPAATTTSTIADTEPTLSEIVISEDATGVPINAEEGEGSGRWLFDWTTAGDIELFVPAGAGTEGTHTATITWSLDDTPL
ncbi:WxL domain-containing protein [Marinilactibacillus sp. GCM10026970]|uniref:WxL domain-containing protein n=1 Tax=Marinilactibacillus sp. GCM10026970 TaxID=3252642 RepID=UPI00361AD107